MPATYSAIALTVAVWAAVVQVGVEGIDQTVLAVVVGAGLASIWCSYIALFAKGHESEEVVAAAAAATRRTLRYVGPSDVCPICLDEVEHRVGTNCGHMLCGDCFTSLYNRANAAEGLRCPVCRSTITLAVGNVEAFPEELKATVAEFNRRYGGMPRSLFELLGDMPTLATEAARSVIDGRGVTVVIRARIAMLLLSAMLYTLSPFDLVPEAVFGLFGLVDDAVVVVLIAYALAATWRGVLTADQ